MGKIHDNVTQLIGGTPLVRLNELDKDLPGNIAVKLEFYSCLLYTSPSPRDS